MKSNLTRQEIELRVPATIANIVCGFDILGFAVREPFDTIQMRITKETGIQIHHTDNFGLPENPDMNVAGIALQAMLKELTDPPGISLQIHKHILPGSGLGSSGASAMGAVATANELFGNIFTPNQLIRFAMEGERMAGGVAHADNVAPCLFGGITLLTSDPDLQVTPLGYPELYVVILHPQIEVKTSDSRKIIKKEISLRKAVAQWSYVAGLVAGFCNKDYELIRRSLRDVIFEPARSLLIPNFSELRSVAIKAGALGGGIAGSGPSVFMLCETETIANEVETVMSQIYVSTGLDFKTYVTTINPSSLL